MLKTILIITTLVFISIDIYSLLTDFEWFTNIGNLSLLFIIYFLWFKFIIFLGWDNLDYKY